MHLGKIVGPEHIMRCWGGWCMNYRDEAEMFKWSEKLDNPLQVYFEYPEERGRYLFLVIKK